MRGHHFIVVGKVLLSPITCHILLPWTKALGSRCELLLLLSAKKGRPASEEIIDEVSFPFVGAANKVHLHALLSYMFLILIVLVEAVLEISLRAL